MKLNRWTFGLILLGVAYGTPVTAQTYPRKDLDFLFAEDNQPAPSPEQYVAFIEPKSLLKQNQWLNAPLTRLDYVLMTMESRLNKSAGEAALEYAPQYFERTSSPFVMRPSAEFSARYYEQKGRILITGEIRDIGKPKKPMKDFCRLMITVLGGVYPLQARGFYWQNTALGVLPRDSASNSEYVEAAADLAKSALYTVNVTSTYKVGDKDAMYQLSCRQQASEGEILYSTYSALLGGR